MYAYVHVLFHFMHVRICLRMPYILHYIMFMYVIIMYIYACICNCNVSVLCRYTAGHGNDHVDLSDPRSKPDHSHVIKLVHVSYIFHMYVYVYMHICLVALIAQFPKML